MQSLNGLPNYKGLNGSSAQSPSFSWKHFWMLSYLSHIPWFTWCNIITNNVYITYNPVLKWGFMSTTCCEGLPPANLCLVTLLSSEQCSQFECFHPQHVQIINNTSSFKTKLTGNNTETSKVNLWCLTFPRSRQQTSRYKLLLCQLWAETLA